MKKTLLFAVVLGLCVTLFTGCGTVSKSTDGSPAATVPISGAISGVAYTVGYIVDHMTGYWQACYWTNGVKTDVGGSIPNLYTKAYGVVNTNLGVYVSGFDYEFNSGHMTAALYKDSSRTTLETVTSNAYGIAVANGAIYVCGFYESTVTPGFNVPCYWKVSSGVTRYDLDVPPGTSGVAWDIAVSGTNVYTCGRSNNSACYWTNSTRTPLAGYFAYAIDVYANAVYCGGNYLSGQLRSCYWVDGVRNTMSNPFGYSSTVYGIDVSDKGIFLGGKYMNSYSDFDHAFTWKDGVIASGNVLNGGQIWGVKQEGTDLYAAGDFCYWKNNVKTTVEGSGTIYVTGIDSN